MTVTQVINLWHALYQGDENYPTSGQDEWTHALKLLEAAIRNWESEEGILWDVLWETLVNASDGDKTVNASDLIYATPTDFVYPGGFIRTYESGKLDNQSYWSVIKPDRADLLLNDNPQAAYITGNESSGFNVNFMDQPTAGHLIDYPYYKQATIPTTGSDVLEMSRPMFAVYHMLGEQHMIDRNGDAAEKAFAQAQAQLDAMRTANQMVPFMQQNDIPDRDFEAGVAGFGV